MASETVSLARDLLRMLLSELKSYPERVFEVLKGERVAREIAAFYKVLVSEGLPQELAESLTRVYAEKLLEKIEPLAALYLERRGEQKRGEKLLSTIVMLDRRARAMVASALLQSLGVPREKIEELLSGVLKGHEERGTGGEARAD